MERMRQVIHFFFIVVVYVVLVTFHFHFESISLPNTDKRNGKTMEIKTK